MTREFDCSICGRVFGRAEHRDRHLATHVTARPYRCSYCHVQFQRTDSLRRHVDKHCTKKRRLDRENSSGTACSNSGSMKPGVRVEAACDSCHDKKLKCDGERPCSRCEKKSQPCSYSRAPKGCLSDFTSELLSPNEDLIVGKSPNSCIPGDQDPSLASHEPPATQSMVPPMATDVELSDVAAISTQKSFTSYESPVYDDATQSVDLAWPGVIGYGFSNGGTTIHNMVGATHMDPLLTIPNSGPWMGFPTLVELENEGEWIDLLSNTIIEQWGEREAALDNFKLLLGSDKEQPVDDGLLHYLQQSLIPRQYDIELLNILINVFMKHVSRVLCSFEGFHITSHTTIEQILVMAAVGELFTQVPRGSQVSNILFVDCSRMMHKWVVSPNCELETMTSRVQALILMEMFGICSENKRAYEVAESHHCTLLQALHQHHSLTYGGTFSEGDATQQQRLVSDVIMLECYRFALFQRMPFLSPMSLLRLSRPGMGQLDLNHKRILGYLYQAPDINHSNSARHLQFPSVHDIAVFSLVSAFTDGQWDEHSYEATNRKWRTDVFDRVLDDVLLGSSACEEVSTNWLCHMIGASMHTPFEQIRGAAYSTTIGEMPQASAVQTIQNWKQSSSGEIALEHSERIIALGMHTFSIAELDTAKLETMKYRESPHDALCVFNAGLVVWASKIFFYLGSGLDCEEACPKHLADAIEVLSKMPARLAMNLMKILTVLKDARK